MNSFFALWDYSGQDFDHGVNGIVVIDLAGRQDHCTFSSFIVTVWFVATRVAVGIIRSSQRIDGKSSTYLVYEESGEVCSSKVGKVS